MTRAFIALVALAGALAGGIARADDPPKKVLRYAFEVAETSFDPAKINAARTWRFNLPAFDAMYQRLQVLPDGPEREALFDQAKRLALAYMPYKFKLNRISVDMAQPQVVGYRRPVFWQEWWHYVDIDDTRRAAAR
jgi:ABC-type transport system substrate-binding protein